jgi:hypothetical protein
MQPRVNVYLQILNGRKSLFEAIALNNVSVCFFNTQIATLPDVKPPPSETSGRLDTPGSQPSSFTSRHPPVPDPAPRTKKGWGPESRARAPDPYDNYDFQRFSNAYIRLRVMGYEFFTLADVVRIGNIVEDQLLAKEKPITERNRAAHRRKPNAFHWLDENWPNITAEMFNNAVIAVLGDPSYPRVRRRHGVKPSDGKGPTCGLSLISFTVVHLM